MCVCVCVCSFRNIIIIFNLMFKIIFPISPNSKTITLVWPNTHLSICFADKLYNHSSLFANFPGLATEIIDRNKNEKIKQRKRKSHQLFSSLVLSHRSVYIGQIIHTSKQENNFIFTNNQELRHQIYNKNRENYQNHYWNLYCLVVWAFLRPRPRSPNTAKI